MLMGTRTRDTQRRGLLLALAAGLLSLLAACGGGGSDDEDGSSGTAQLRLVNASRAYASLGLAADGSSLASGVAYGQASSYANVSTSGVSLQVQSGGSTVVAQSATLAAGTQYSLISYGWAGQMRSTLLQEEESAPDAGNSKLLVMNLAPDAGTLDVYLTQNTDDLGNATPVVAGLAGSSSSSYLSLASGSYRLRITGSGRLGDLRLDIPAVTLASQGVATLLITPTPGGVLVGGVLVAQQGAVSAHGGGMARARVVATLADQARVTAQLGEVAMLASSVAPAIGDYQIVPAGSSAGFSYSVNGQTQTPSSPTLAEGQDYTLLLWGTPAAPQLQLIADDNRLPASNTARLRLINGVARLDAGLSLVLDYSAIASNVQPGNASAAALVNASSSSLLQVNSPTAGTPVYSVASLPVLSGGVYTVFMMGGAENMIGTLRKER